MSRSATAVAFFVIVSTVSAQDRLSIPNDAAQKEADELVQMVFGDEIRAARKSDEKLALTKKLLAEAAKPDTSPAGRYAILKTALELSPDAVVAISVIDEIARHFDVDALRLKASTSWRMSKKAKSRAEHASVVEAATALMNEFVQKHDYDSALKLGEIAAQHVRGVTPRAVVQGKIARVRKQKEQYDEYMEAYNVLEDQPADGAANLVVGKYIAFVTGDWTGGLPYLAICSDAALKELATKELDEPKVSMEQVTLADGWYDLAQQSDEGDRERMLQRAGFWYRLSLNSEPALPRLMRAKVKKRLENCIVDLADPTGPLPAGPYARRSRRAEAVRQAGGNAASEAAVEAGLQWLASHQNRDGSWSFVHTPGDKCSGFPNPGEKKTRMGATGLALLPFLGAGYTHQDGKHRDTVRNGLKYLVGNMQVANNAGRLYEANGDGHSHMYSHGIAACALVEAYGMTKDRKLKAPAQLALNYIVQAQHPDNGGWLYTPRAGGDTSVTSWQVMALKSGILSALQVPNRVNALANKWLDSVQWNVPRGSRIGASYGYRKPQDRPSVAACTAIGLICRNYLGSKKGDPGLQMGVEKLGQAGPKSGDMYYNYYGSMVMFQNDGPDGKLWNLWNTKMRDYLVETQEKKGDQQGSWSFRGGHGSRSGGRIYDTAMAVMTLEVYYRYPLVR